MLNVEWGQPPFVFLCASASLRAKYISRKGGKAKGNKDGIAIHGFNSLYLFAAMRLDLLKYLLVIAFCIMFQYGYGSPGYVAKALMGNKPFYFEENKGQLVDQNGVALHDIKYYGQQGGVNIYMRSDKISFVFSQTKNIEENISESNGLTIAHPNSTNNTNLPTKTKTIFCRTELAFIGADPNAEITATDLQEYYENFYGANRGDQGISHVNTYKTITYKNIYSHIDMVLYAKPKGLEYSFIVHKGGNVSDIKLSWNGINNNASLTDSGFCRQNTLGYIKESLPIGFSNGKTIKSQLIRTGGFYGFRVGNYDKGQDIIIDPNLIWATYYGGNGGAAQIGINVDASDNVYLCGYTTSTAGIATTGAYQTSFTGSSDAFLTKFNPSGNSIAWSTYFGGSGFSVANGVMGDGSGSVYIAGYTFSSGLATTGTYQTSNGGNEDAFLAKFKSNGSLVWSTYFGGSGYDAAKAINIDHLGRINMVGSTTSTTGIATSGAYKTSFGGGTSLGDGFVAVFRTSGGLAWASYFGSSNEDGASGVGTDVSSNIFICGRTNSAAGIASSGAYQTSYGGEGNSKLGDEFLTKFDSSGSLGWSTYFGGMDDEVATGLAVSNKGDIYITGWTSSYGLATSGAYLTFPGAIDNVYLAKFNGSGKIQWSTYYEGAGDIGTGNGIAVDTVGNIFITGSGSNTNFNIATCGAYQSSITNQDDAFLAEFSSAGNLVWATYFGKNSMNYGNALSTDPSGNIFLSGYTDSKSVGMATSGAYQTSPNSTGNAYSFVAKFSRYVTDAGISSIQPKADFCTKKQNISMQIKNYGTLEIDSVRINYTINKVPQTSYYWKGKLKPDSTANVTVANYLFGPGKYTLKSWTSQPNGIKDSAACNDSATAIFTVDSLPIVNAGGNHAICLGDNIQLGKAKINGHIYAWTSKPSGFTSSTSNPTTSPVIATSYYLTETITSTGCTSTDTATIKVNPLPIPDAGGSHIACAGDSSLLGTTPTAGETYDWTSNPLGFSSFSSDPKVAPVTTTVYYLTETTTATGCKKSDSALVSVYPLPPASTGKDQSVCAGTLVTIGASPISGDAYSWTSKPLGFSSTLAKPSFKPAKTAVYYLTETNSATGCSKTDSVLVRINPLPKPNAGADQNICMGKKVVIGSSTSGTNVYQWQRIPSGFSASAASAVDSPKTSSIYILSETDTTTGCKNSDTMRVTVNLKPSPPNIQGSGSLCENDSPFTYSLPPDSSIAWDWGISNGHIISGQGTNQVLVSFSPGMGVVSVKETDTKGCQSDNAIKNITINIAPNAHFTVAADSPTYRFLAMDTLQQTYLWDFGDVTSANGFKLLHRYPFIKDSDVKVTLTVSSSPGCTSIFDSVIHIHYFPTPDFNIDVFPNPTNDVFNVRIKLIRDANIKILVYDETGKLLNQLTNEKQLSGPHTYTFHSDGNNWRHGIYFLKIIVGITPFVIPLMKN